MKNKLTVPSTSQKALGAFESLGQPPLSLAVPGTKPQAVHSSVRHRTKPDQKPAPWKTPPFTLTELWESFATVHDFPARATVIEATNLRGLYFLGATTYFVILKNNLDHLLLGNMDERNRKLEPYLIRKFKLCRTVIARTAARKEFEQAAEVAFVMGGLCMSFLALSFNDDSKSVGQKKYDALCREIDVELDCVAQKLSDTQPASRILVDPAKQDVKLRANNA